MDYKEALEYINKTEWFGSRPGLARVGALLEKLGRPQDGMKFIHVAGTSNVASAYAATYPIALIAVVLVSQLLVRLF